MGPAQAERLDKPWGYELLWARTDHYAGKILHIIAGEALSLQYHRRKEETLYLLVGTLELELGDDDQQMRTIILQPGQCVHIPAGQRHRLTARTMCEVFEVSTPELDDVVRLADRYGRSDLGEG
ncbi:MAG: cupin domain-containing protein [Candidatus Binatia bacterium]